MNKGQFIATDSSKHSVVLSTQDAENPVGMKPSDLLLAAVGGCSIVDVVSTTLEKVVEFHTDYRIVEEE